MGQSLPVPVTSQIIETKNEGYFHASYVGMCGKRYSMEDRHCISMENGWILVSVFDGHAGSGCAQFISTYLLQKLKIRERQGTHIANGMLTRDALNEICIELDREFINERDPSGTTAAFVIVHSMKKDRAKVTVCNLGDSRIVIARKIDKKLLMRFQSIDHKPRDKEEEQRIIRCGGDVQMDRVNGQLAVSRAFGDNLYKMSSLDPYEQLVIAIPDVNRNSLGYGGDIEIIPGDMIVVHCDGIYEAGFESEDMLEHISEIFYSSKNLVETTREVSMEAIRRGSQDNVSTSILYFRKEGEHVKNDGPNFIPGPVAFSDNPKFLDAWAESAMIAGVSKPSTITALKMRLNTLEGLLKTNTDLSYIIDTIGHSPTYSGHYQPSEINTINGQSVWVKKGEEKKYLSATIDGKWALSEIIGSSPNFTSAQNISIGPPDIHITWKPHGAKEIPIIIEPISGSKNLEDIREEKNRIEELLDLFLK